MYSVHLSLACLSGSTQLQLDSFPYIYQNQQLLYLTVVAECSRGEEKSEVCVFLGNCCLQMGEIPFV